MQKRIVTFVCGHTVQFGSPYPKVGDAAWCMRCRKATTVLMAPGEWRLRCLGCVYSRSYGEVRYEAEIAIGRHRATHQTHAVKLYNGNKLIMTFGQVRGSKEDPQKIF